MDPLDLDFETVYASCADLLNENHWPTATIDEIYNELRTLEEHTPVLSISKSEDSTVLQPSDMNGFFLQPFIENPVYHQLEVSSDPSASMQTNHQVEPFPTIPEPSHEGSEYLEEKPGNSQHEDLIKQEEIERKPLDQHNQTNEECLDAVFESQIENYIEEFELVNTFESNMEMKADSPCSETPSNAPTEIIYRPQPVNTPMSVSALRPRKPRESPKNQGAIRPRNVRKLWKGISPRPQVIKLVHQYLERLGENQSRLQYLFKHRDGVPIKHFRQCHYEKLLRLKSWRRLTELHCMRGEYITLKKRHYCTTCYAKSNLNGATLTRAHQMVSNEDLWSYFCSECVQPLLHPAVAYNCPNCVLAFTQWRIVESHRAPARVTIIKEFLPMMSQRLNRKAPVTPENTAHERTTL